MDIFTLENSFILMGIYILSYIWFGSRWQFALGGRKSIACLNPVRSYIEITQLGLNSIIKDLDNCKSLHQYFLSCMNKDSIL